MALYKGETLLAGSGAGFMPESEGETGQVLKKTETGYRWNDLAEGGEEGQVLMKTENGYAWCDSPGGIKYAKIDILIVGGGGGGGAGLCCSSYYYRGGGGGGGGFLQYNGYVINSSVSCHAIVVGCGGCPTKGYTSSYSTANGGNSCFDSIVAYGGGGGGVQRCANYIIDYCGRTGGSGGGSISNSCYSDGCPGQGYRGGYGYCPYNCGDSSGGGGGGAGGIGGNSSSNVGGKGGIGKCSDISGETKWYSGGGGGFGATSCGAGGCGGGGKGSSNATYYGGGGGGSYNNYGGCDGYQGIVIIRYKTDGSCGIKNTSFGGRKYTWGDYTIHCFTTVGTERFVPVFK